MKIELKEEKGHQEMAQRGGIKGWEEAATGKRGDERRKVTL